jgi:Cu/Ag efflux protein CusF
MRVPLLTSRRGFAVAAAVVLAGCTREKKSTTPIKTYKLTGEVKRLEPDRSTAVIKHEPIEGWMEAMTMEFPVRDKAEFARLVEGKRITATVNVQDLDYWLTDIQVQ